jgi:hypothetical protein
VDSKKGNVNFRKNGNVNFRRFVTGGAINTASLWVRRFVTGSKKGNVNFCQKGNVNFRRLLTGAPRLPRSSFFHWRQV